MADLARPARDDAAQLLGAAASTRAAVGLAPSTVPAGAARSIALARSVGAPVADVLERAAEVARARADVHDEARVAAAQATAVARTMLALPLVAVPGLGVLLDLPMVAFYATPGGTALGVMGAVALGLAAGWAWLLRRSVHTAAAAEPVAAEALELVAVAASAAVPLTSAVRRAADALEASPQPATGSDRAAHDTVAELRRLAMADDLGVDGTASTALCDLADVVTAHRHRGVAGVGLLRHAADARRAVHRVVVRERAQRLSAQLVLPTALLVLPATVALVAGPLLAVALDTAT